LVNTEIAVFADPALARIARQRRDLPDADKTTIADRLRRVDAEVETASIIRRELEQALADVVATARTELGRIRSTWTGNPAHLYPFDAKLTALANEGATLLREGAAAIEQQAAVTRDALRAIERAGSLAEPTGAREAREGKVTRDSVRAASHEELQLMPL